MQRVDQHAGYLLRANTKQNLKFIVIWGIILLSMLASGAVKLAAAFEDPKQTSQIVGMFKLPAFVGMFGAVPAGPQNAATIFAAVMLVFMAILGAVMNIQLAVANTRGQEESGLLETVRARTVGRGAALEATVVELVGLNALLGILYTLSLIGIDLSGSNLAGSVLMGAGLALSGLMFGALALLFSQIASTAKTASMLSYLFLGASYLVRMTTDIQNPALTWWSPLGWIQKLDVYGNNHWLALLVMGIATVGLLIASTQIAQNRDLGVGLIPDRTGRATARPWLRSIAALLVKTERGMMVTWLFVAIAFGGLYGNIFGSVGDVLKTNPLYRQLLNVDQVNIANRQLVLSFMTMLISLFVGLAVLAGALIIFRLKRDDRQGYLGIVHAEKISRVKLITTYTVIGMGLAVLVFVLGVLAMFWIGGQNTAFALPNKDLWAILVAGVLATLAFTGLATAVVGVMPQLTGIYWLYLGVALILKTFGKILALPNWVIDLSPFGWIGAVPVDPLAGGWLWTMLVLWLGLALVGIYRYRQRDLIVA